MSQIIGELDIHIFKPMQVTSVSVPQLFYFMKIDYMKGTTSNAHDLTHRKCLFKMISIKHSDQKSAQIFLHLLF